MPEESDLVLCTITKIQYHSVFARLDEYENKTGMIHISEISPGRIRNIYDFVKVGKVVVCKVLRIHPRLGHIDLSLRRVSEGQRRMKMDEIKQEQLAEKVIELLANKLNKDFKKLYYEIAEPILKKYTYVHDCFLESLTNKKILEKYVKKEYLEDLYEIIKQRNKPKEIHIKEQISIKSYSKDGLIKIKKTLQEIETLKNLSIKYHGGGMYDLVVTHTDFKEAEKIIKKANSIVENISDSETNIKIERIN